MRSRVQAHGTPDPDFHGSERLQYEACPHHDDHCDRCEIILRIEAVNDAPRALADVAALLEDTEGRLPAWTTI